MTHANLYAAALAVCLLAVIPTPVAGQAQTGYELTPLELPPELAGVVRAVDINNRGTVLGWLLDLRFGVVVDKKGARTFTIPGATYMEPDAILANGTIAVHYYDLSGNRGPFLVDRKGTLTPVIVEGDWEFVNVWDVSDNGIVAGEVRVTVPGLPSTTLGFVQDRKETRIIQCPGAQSTGLTSVNNRGTAAGACTGDPGRFTVSRDGIFTELSAPGIPIFFPESINNRGVIAGRWSDGINSGAGVLEDGALTAVDFPAPPTIDYHDPATGTIHQLSLASSYTNVTGINDRGEIAGFTEGSYFPPDFAFEVIRVYSFTGTPVH